MSNLDRLRRAVKANVRQHLKFDQPIDVKGLARRLSTTHAQSGLSVEAICAEIEKTVNREQARRDRS